MNWWQWVLVVLVLMGLYGVVAAIVQDNLRHLEAIPENEEGGWAFFWLVNWPLLLGCWVLQTRRHKRADRERKRKEEDELLKKEGFPDGETL